MFVLIFSALVFATIAVGAYSVYVEARSTRSPIAARLRELRSTRSGATVNFGDRPPALLKAVAQLGGFLPARDGRNALRTGLIQAGFRRPEAVTAFLGSKVILAVAVPAAWLAFAFAARQPASRVFALAIAAGVLGFYLPTIFIALRRNWRHDAVLASLPDALDLLVICVEAGLGVTAGLQRVATEMRLSSPVLAGELAIVNQEMQAGVSRTDSLRNLAERTGVDEVYALVAMLIQTDRLGTSVGQALRSHADSMRTKRRQRAEQLARKATVKLAFPLVLLILPALLVVILGPAAIQLMKALAAS